MLDYLVSLALIAPVAVGVVLLARLATRGRARRYVTVPEEDERR